MPANTKAHERGSIRNKSLATRFLFCFFHSMWCSWAKSSVSWNKNTPVGRPCIVVQSNLTLVQLEQCLNVKGNSIFVLLSLSLLFPVQILHLTLTSLYKGHFARYSRFFVFKLILSDHYHVILGRRNASSNSTFHHVHQSSTLTLAVGHIPLLWFTVCIHVRWSSADQKRWLRAFQVLRALSLLKTSD